jgi:hypothetical protein
MWRWAAGEPRVPVRMLFPTNANEDYQGKPVLLQGWECRDEFFKLPQNENSLLAFLAKVGVWSSIRAPTTGHWSKEVMRHARDKRGPLPIQVDEIWNWRKMLGDALVKRRGFIKEQAPARTPRTLADALWGVPRSNKFSLSFELEGNPKGIATVKDAHHMLLTTVYVDIVRGLGFKYCQRSDCGAPFPVTSKHKRKFCTHECGHLETVRRKRSITRRTLPVPYAVASR